MHKSGPQQPTPPDHVASPDATSQPEPAEHQQSATATMVGGEQPREIGGRDGPDPVRYGDWEKGGRCIDF